MIARLMTVLIIPPMMILLTFLSGLSVTRRIAAIDALTRPESMPSGILYFHFSVFIAAAAEMIIIANHSNISCRYFVLVFMTSASYCEANGVGLKSVGVGSVSYLVYEWRGRLLTIARPNVI